MAKKNMEISPKTLSQLAYPKIISVGNLINSLPDGFNACVFAFVCMFIVF